MKKEQERIFNRLDKIIKDLSIDDKKSVGDDMSTDGRESGNKDL